MKDLRQYITNDKPSEEYKSIYANILKYCHKKYDFNPQLYLEHVLNACMDSDDIVDSGWADSPTLIDMGMEDYFSINIVLDALLGAGNYTFEADNFYLDDVDASYDEELDDDIFNDIEDDTERYFRKVEVVNALQINEYHDNLTRLFSRCKITNEEKQSYYEFIDGHAGCEVQYLFIESEQFRNLDQNILDELRLMMNVAMIDETHAMGAYISYDETFYLFDWDMIINILESHYQEVNNPENHELIELLNCENWEYPIMNNIAVAIKKAFDTKTEVIF